MIYVIIGLALFSSLGFFIYRSTRTDKQMIMMFPDPNNGQVKIISKYQKTWYDKLMEWLPQSMATALITFMITTILFFDVRVEVNLTFVFGIITGLGFLVTYKILTNLVKLFKDKHAGNHSNSQAQFQASTE